MSPKSTDQTQQPAHPITRWWRTISIDLFRLSLVALAPSLVGFAYWCVVLPKSDPRATWPVVSAPVSSLSTRDEPCRKTRYSFGDCAYSFRYSFRLAEFTYSGSHSGCAENRQSAAERLSSILSAPLHVLGKGDFTTEFDPTGHQILVHYNPQNPADHTISLRTPYYFWVVGILTGAAIVLSLLSGPGVVFWNLLLLRLYKDSGKTIRDTFVAEIPLLDDVERSYLDFRDPKIKALQQAAMRALREMAPADANSIEIVTKMLLKPDRIYFDLILSSDAKLSHAKQDRFEERFLSATRKEAQALALTEEAVNNTRVELHSRQTINRQGADAYWR